MKKSMLFDTGCTHCNVRIQSVFNVLEDQQLTEMSMYKSCSTYKKGQYVFSENALPTGLYCINTGKIKITTIGFDGKEQILRLANSGEIVGYLALISNERYSSSAVAIEDASICLIDKSYFFNILASSPKLMFQVVKRMSRDLREAEDHIVSLSQKNVRERMAEALLFLKATYGYEADNQTINVILTREEIADYVGTSTESCIRLLSEFNQSKMIALNGKKISIINLPELIQTANIED